MKVKWPKKRYRYRIAFFVGVLLIFLGIQLRVVDSFVLRPGPTRVLVDWFGAPAGTVQGGVERLVVEATSLCTTITPPVWLGWASITTGVILSAYSVLGKKWR